MSLTAFKSIPVPLSQLSLPAVLKCGQSFRWSTLTPAIAVHETDPEASLPRVEYRLCLKDRVVCLRQSSDTLFYRSVFPDSRLADKHEIREAETLGWLNDYFQLDIDLVSLYKQWSEKDHVFAKFQERFEGIRMLRQDPWENLVSFICSSNNNISRITKMVQNLCRHYSPVLLSVEHPFSPNEKLEYHAFPPPSALAGPDVGVHLRSLGFGYRADFIQRTAKMLVDAHGTSNSTSPHDSMEASEVWLKGLRKSSTADARAELLKFVGVGRKVADCILLMSMDKKEVVPVDTHVYQIAVKHYGLKAPTGGKANMTPKLYEELNSKFFAIWGEYAGWAHSVLFTADLKSFSSHGLPPSTTALTSPVRSPSKKHKRAVEKQFGLVTPPMTPGDSPLKRRLQEEIQAAEEREPSTPGLSQLCKDAEDQLSLVDRVKKRRRKV